MWEEQRGEGGQEEAAEVAAAAALSEHQEQQRQRLALSTKKAVRYLVITPSSQSLAASTKKE